MSEATATVGNSKIVWFCEDRGSNTVVFVKLDANGKTQQLDRRAVNSSLNIGQRGWLEYREYEFGSRWFFDGVTIHLPAAVCPIREAGCTFQRQASYHCLWCREVCMPLQLVSLPPHRKDKLCRGQKTA